MKTHNLRIGLCFQLSLIALLWSSCSSRLHHLHKISVDRETSEMNVSSPPGISFHHRDTLAEHYSLMVVNAERTIPDNHLTLRKIVRNTRPISHANAEKAIAKHQDVKPLASGMVGQFNRVTCQPPEPRRLNTMALLSVISVFVVGPLCLVFGVIALDEIRQTGERGKILAYAGIGMGIFLILFILMIIVLLSL